MYNFLNKLIVSFELVFLPVVFFSCLVLRRIRNIGLANFNHLNELFNKVGLYPIIDHYSEPLFNKKKIMKPLSNERNLPGIDFNITYQIELLKNFNYNNELLRFPIDKTSNGDFFYHNNSFESGDAEFLYNIIRFYKPKKIIEIGAGFSTLISINAIKKNTEEDINYYCEHFCIDPYPADWLQKSNVDLIVKKVEDCDIDLFCSLNTNDILFIDSSHIIRTQGDVLYEYLEILPVLNSGVLVHIHDIFTPRDYLDEWLEGNLRFQNEQYLLEALLTANNKFRVIGALNFLKNNYFNELTEKCPILKGERFREPGSFWILKL